MSVRRLEDSQRKRAEELVARYQIVFHSASAQEPLPDGISAVGFDVELSGTHGAGAGTALPGCPRCRAIFESLEEVAAAVLPEGLRASSCERKGFDHALHSIGREKRNDVQLIVTIRHRDDFAAPIDACERRCLEDIKDGLRALGACENKWNDAGAPARKQTSGR